MAFFARRFSNSKEDLCNSSNFSHITAIEFKYKDSIAFFVCTTGTLFINVERRKEMNKSKLSLVVASLLLVSAGVAAVDKNEVCYPTPTGEWVCEPVLQPMGPGSGGTGGDDDEPVVKK